MNLPVGSVQQKVSLLACFCCFEMQMTCDFCQKLVEFLERVDNTAVECFDNVAPQGRISMRRPSRTNPDPSAIKFIHSLNWYEP